MNRKLVSHFNSSNFVVLTTLLLFLSVFNGIERALLFDIVFSLCFLLMPYAHIVECLCFLFPLATTYQYAHIYLIALVLCFCKRKSINIKNCLCILFVILLEISTYYLYKKDGFNRMLGYLVTISLVIMLIHEKKMLIDREACIKNYIIGTAVLFATYMLNVFLQYDLSYILPILTGKMRLGSTGSSLLSNADIAINANYLAYYSVCGMGCILTLLQAGCLSEKEKNLFRILFAFITAIGAMSLSRTWIIVVLLLFLSYVAATNGNIAKTLYRLIVLIIAGSIILFYLSETTDIIESFILRFTTENIETAGNRTTTIEEYLTAFFASDKLMLFGTGVTDYAKVIANSTSIHNALVQVLVCCGIPGAIVILSILYMPAVTAIRKNVNLLYWIPLMVQFTFVQTIQFFNPCTLMLPHIIGIFSLQMNLKPKKHTRSHPTVISK